LKIAVSAKRTTERRKTHTPLHTAVLVEFDLNIARRLRLQNFQRNVAFRTLFADRYGYSLLSALKETAMLHEDFYFELNDDIVVASEAGCEWHDPAAYNAMSERPQSSGIAIESK
jgi:hypothetical protein